jgi:hypothetical protein
MLTNNKITLEARVTVNDADICRFLAIISDNGNNISFLTQMIDKDACKQYRDIVRDDRAAFEDWAYEVQEQQLGSPEQVDILE